MPCISGEKPKAEIKETQGSSANQIKLDCIVTYNSKRVTEGISWVDAEGKTLSDNSHVEVTLKPGTNVMKCKYAVGGWTGYKTIMKMLHIGGSGGGSSSGRCSAASLSH